MNFSFKNTIRRMFGYDATETKGRRNAAPVSSKSEDRELNAARRKILNSNAEDQQRNITLCRWIINKHLDFITKFTIQVKTDDLEFNARAESLLNWWSRPKNCDVAGRHSFQRMIRILEALAIVTGDAGILKLKNGQLQGIEGTRIRTPSSGNLPEKYKDNPDAITQGVVTDRNGKAIAYLVNDRTKSGGFEFGRAIRAVDTEWHGFYDRWDQIRGISPLAAALNTVRDLYESLEYALLKAKFHSFFGVAIMSDGTEEDGFRPVAVNDKDTDGDDDIDADDEPRYEFDLKTGMKLELNAGDKIDTIESKTPSTEFQDYSVLMIQIALLALDIPLTFFDSRKSSFSAGRSDLALYLQSADAKRENLFDKVRNIVFWKFGQWSRPSKNGDAPLLPLPEGMSVRDIKINIIPAGQPWVDRLKEVNADAMEIAIGVKSRQRACAERGYDFFETLSELEAEEKAIEKSKVTIQYAHSGAITSADESTVDGGGSNNEEEGSENE